MVVLSQDLYDEYDAIIPEGSVMILVADRTCYNATDHKTYKFASQTKLVRAVDSEPWKLLPLFDDGLLYCEKLRREKL